ncbi:hypothetical protein ACQK5W_15790 [Pantoea sp. FN060301]|uniref:hypothetical protein n=1 Tax=Pantoea sp. FN060301 TaxID=3420380 RepID=UPI003D17AB7C
MRAHAPKAAALISIALQCGLNETHAGAIKLISDKRQNDAEENLPKAEAPGAW